MSKPTPYTLTPWPLRHKELEMSPLLIEDSEPIRCWRNQQIEILRQTKPISQAEQERYFMEVIQPSFELEKPPQILTRFTDNNELIGYGGLVHINWEEKQAELSFLLNPSYSSIHTNQDDFLGKTKTQILLLMELAFDHLKFQRVTTEAYTIRTQVIELLDQMGFERASPLTNKSTLLDGKGASSIIQYFNAANWSSLYSRSN